MLRRAVVVGVAACALNFCPPPSAHAQAAASSGNCPYWIDVATGRPVTPPGFPLTPAGNPEIPRATEWSHYARGPSGGWIDVKTGKPVTPPGFPLTPAGNPDIPRATEWSHYALVPCPPSTQTSWSSGTNIQFHVEAEAGGGGAVAKYDELSVDTRSFLAGGYVGARLWQSSNWFMGVQAGAFGTNLAGEAARGLTAGLEVGIPVDIQFGTKVATPFTAMPVTLYGFAGPMWGISRTVSAGVTDTFLLFGGTIGAGVEFDLTDNLSLGARARYFNLGAANDKAEGQQVEGASATVTLKYKFYSDIRLKRDIIALERLDNGLSLYRYRYLWSDTAYVGVMAQEVAAVMPEAVERGADGYLLVDYARLGLRLQTWEEWTATH